MKAWIAWTAGILLMAQATGAQAGTHHMCAWTGGTLKDGTPIQVLTNIFTAADDREAEDKFDIALDREYKVRPSYVYCLAGTPVELEQARNRMELQSQQAGRRVFRVEIDGPSPTAVTKSSRFGPVEYWGCSAYHAKGNTLYLSSTGQVPHVPGKSYTESLTEFKQAWAAYLLRTHRIDIGKGGTCSRAPNEAEVAATHDSAKVFFADNHKAKSVLTDWVPAPR